MKTLSDSPTRNLAFTLINTPTVNLLPLVDHILSEAPFFGEDEVETKDQLSVVRSILQWSMDVLESPPTPGPVWVPRGTPDFPRE